MCETKTTNQSHPQDEGHHALVSQQQICTWLERVAQERDRQAFENLFNYFGPRLCRYMQRLGTGVAQTEELVQDTMTEVWIKAHQYRPTLGAPSTWVFTIARNLRIDYIRKRNRRAEMPMSPYDPMASLTIGEEIRVDALQLMDRLRDLPQEQREVLQLAFLEGLSQAEISDRLGVPIGTVKSRIRLAFTSIRRALRHK